MTKATVLDIEQLRRGGTLVFDGLDHGGVDTSFFLVRARPGSGPALHRHPYDEIWILDQGQVTFRAGDRTLAAGPGSIVIVPAGTAHSFRNTGSTPLHMTCIHPRPAMETEWLESRGGPDDRPEPGAPGR